jgi:hypothetical protein
MGDITAYRGMNSPILEKLEEHGHHGEGSSGSVGSTPEADALEQDTPQAQEPGQTQQKRKGGRKPVSADPFAILRATRPRCWMETKADETT